MKLQHYVEIAPVANTPAPPEYQVRFVVGNQSFSISVVQHTLKEAVWFRDQFLQALKVMVGEVTDS